MQAVDKIHATTTLLTDMKATPVLSGRKSVDVFDEQVQANSSNKSGMFLSRRPNLFASFTGSDLNRRILKHTSIEEHNQAIKLSILKCNPAIYNRFRDSLLRNKIYTHWGVSHCLAEFLDNELRMPELRDEIQRFCTDKTIRGAGILAYLTGGGDTPVTCKSTIRYLVGFREGYDECDKTDIPSMGSTEESEQEDKTFDSRECCVEGIRLEL